MIPSPNTSSTYRTHPGPDNPVVKEIERRLGLLKEGHELSGLTTKLGLVVEGGGMRGVVSGGALIAMERVGLTSVFDEVYGESAGAKAPRRCDAGQYRVDPGTLWRA